MHTIGFAVKNQQQQFFSFGKGLALPYCKTGAFYP